MVCEIKLRSDNNLERHEFETFINEVIYMVPNQRGSLTIS